MLETFFANIWNIGKTIPTKIRKEPIDKTSKKVVIVTNQNVNPAETVKALNLGEDNFILNRINESY